MNILQALLLLIFLYGCDSGPSKNIQKNFISGSHQKLYSYPEDEAIEIPRNHEHIILVNTNDISGQAFPHYETVDSIPVENPKRDLRYGGFAIQKAYFDILRKKFGKNVLFFDSGDFFKGSLLSDINRGEPLIDIINYLNYDLVSPGPHDFTYGSISELPHETIDAQGAIKRNYSKINTPVVISNILDIKTGNPVNWQNVYPYKIIEVAGIKIGVLAGLTEDALKRVDEKFLNGLYLQPLAESFLKYSKKLKSMGATVIVGLVHGNGRCGEKLAQEEGIPLYQVNFDTKKSDLCDKTGSIFKLINKLPPGTLDVMFVGDHHSKIANEYKGVSILKSFSNGDFFSRIDLYIDKSSKKITFKKINQPTKLCYEFIKETNDCYNGNPETNGTGFVPASYLGEAVRPDNKVLNLLKLKSLQLKPYYQKLITDSNFALDFNQNVNSFLPFFTAMAMKYKVESDFAMINLTSLRGRIDKGRLAYSHFYSAMPFDYYILKVKVSGKQLKKIIEFSFSKTEKEQSVFAGLKIVRSGSSKRNLIKSIRDLSGNSLKDNQVYSLAITSFIGDQGGEKYGQFFDSIPESDKERIQDVTYRSATIELLKSVNKGNDDLLKEIKRRKNLWLTTLN